MPKAVPGARPTLAWSTMSIAACPASVDAVDREEQIECAGRHAETRPAGRGEHAADDVARLPGARDLAATNASPWSSAAMRAALHELRDARGRILDQVLEHRFSAGCVLIQPMRQPVIAQFFEKVLTNRMRSSGSMMSRKDGARLRHNGTAHRSRRR